jgi:hypothetical protein
MVKVWIPGHLRKVPGRKRRVRIKGYFKEMPEKYKTKKEE